jgi:hypothetical protein
MGITLLDKNQFFSPGLSYLLNEALPYPTTAMAFYGGNSISRTIIAVEVLSKALQK